MENTKLAIAQRYIDVDTTEWNTPIDSQYHRDWEAWKQLTIECLELCPDYPVREVAESEPYASATDMFQALERGRVFRVSNLNSQHPIWTPQENILFRVCHDILGHYAARANFSWKGEVTAYLEQSKHHSELAKRALFTEIVGQTAYYSVFKEFPEQKCFLYPQEIIDNAEGLLV